MKAHPTNCMKYLLCALFTTSLLLPLRADEASHQQAARELLKVSETEKMTDQLLGEIDAMMDQSFAAAGLPEEAVAEWANIKSGMNEWMADFFKWEEMEPMYVEIYTSVFTEEELRQLTAFYQSPLGQKMIEKMPALTRKSMEVTMNRMQKKMPELQNRMNEKIVELQKRYPASTASPTSS